MRSLIARRSLRRFSFDEQEQEHIVQFDPAHGRATVAQGWKGRKLSSLDRADMMLVRPTSIAVSRLAPYKGWESFLKEAQAAWTDLHHVVTKPILSRIGVRYINRIDAPQAFGTLAERLVNIHPSLPPLSEEPMKHYFVQATLRLAHGLSVTINSQPVESPVPAHFGFLLDIDVYVEENIPLRDDELWTLIESTRAAKNCVFEALITNEARELFQQ